MKLCQEEEYCTNRQCPDSHPDGRGFQPSPCPFGTNCNTRHSTCGHLIHGDIVEGLHQYDDDHNPTNQPQKQKEQQDLTSNSNYLYYNSDIQQGKPETTITVNDNISHNTPPNTPPLSNQDPIDFSSLTVSQVFCSGGVFNSIDIRGWNEEEFLATLKIDTNSQEKAFNHSNSPNLLANDPFMIQNHLLTGIGMGSIQNHLPTGIGMDSLTFPSHTIFPTIDMIPPPLSTQLDLNLNQTGYAIPILHPDQNIEQNTLIAAIPKPMAHPNQPIQPNQLNQPVQPNQQIQPQTIPIKAKKDGKSGKDCAYGLKCTSLKKKTFICLYNHPELPASTTTGIIAQETTPILPPSVPQKKNKNPNPTPVDCFHKTKCCKSGCPHLHPAERSKNTCSKGVNCLFKETTCNMSHIQLKFPKKDSGKDVHPPDAMKLCRFKEKCSKPDCQFIHPPPRDCTTTDNDVKCCIQGAKCNKPSCIESHPPERARMKCVKGMNCKESICTLTHVPITCTSKDLCRAPHCQNLHPVEDLLSICRFGGKCSKHECKFSHPAPTSTTTTTSTATATTDHQAATMTIIPTTTEKAKAQKFDKPAQEPQTATQTTITQPASVMDNSELSLREKEQTEELFRQLSLL